MNELRPRLSRTRKGIARHGRLRRNGSWSVIGKIVLSAFTVVAVSVVSLGAYAAWDLSHSIKPSVHLVGESAQPIPDIGAIKGGVNLLIAASDTRSGQGGAYGTTEDSSGAGLNDVTMLLHISGDHTSATVVSFPRDLMVPIPECPDGNGGWNSSMYKQQINTTLEDGGLACTVLTVEQLTGVKIPFAGVVHFTGVVAMSNAIGGVPVCIVNGIYDPDTELNLDPGEHTLKGQQAAQFLRTRHGVGDGSDLSRISNQQVFLSSLVRTIKSADTLSNPAKVWGLAKATVNNVTLSQSLDNVTTLYQIAVALKDINLDKVLFLQYPVLTDPDNINRVVPDSEGGDTIFSAIAADTPLKLGGGTGDGAVVNDPTSTPTDATSTGGPDDTSTTSAKPGAPIVLPDNVRGQTAGTQTCSKGNN